MGSELAGAMVGSLFVAIGAAAIAASLSARPRREPTPLWFGLFCLLYGIRLSASSELVEAAIPWSAAVFDYIEAFVTYSILIPAGLFVESLVGPGWQSAIRRTWQVTCVYAVGAALNDLAQGQPFASMWLNAPLVVLTSFVGCAHLVGLVRGGSWPMEVRAVAATAALFIAVAMYETIARRSIFGRSVEAEPIAMLLFTAALGWFVLVRARQRAYAFVALSRELELARAIQQSLLPREMPALPGVRIQGAYLPMSAVAGDFYDLALLADGRLVVIVADVSGHGVPAALVASMVKVAFAAEAERYDRPGDVLAGINRALTGKFERAYVTACCVVVNRARETLAYAAAGHPPAVLRRHDGRIERLADGGVALALLPVAGYSSTDVSFHTGDRLLLFTDGLTEASRGNDDEFFGDAEFDRVVAGLVPSRDVPEAVLDAHRRWIGAGTPLADDVTLVVVEFTPP